MRGTVFWTASTLLAFAVTAIVFLTLAELGTSPQQRLSGGEEQSDEPDNPLSIEMDQAALGGLKEEKDQSLGITLGNGSERRLTDITVYLTAYSEDTADQKIRYYEAKVSRLDSLESKRVTFDELDLSPANTENQPQESATSSDAREEESKESFNTLEFRASASEGVSTVKTAVLAF